MRQTSAGEDLIREGLDGLPDLRVTEEVELVEVVIQLVQLLSPLEPFRLWYLFDKNQIKMSLGILFEKHKNTKNTKNTKKTILVQQYGSCNFRYAVPFCRV